MTLVIGSGCDGRLYHGGIGWDPARECWVVVSPDLAEAIEAGTLAEALAELRRVAGLTPAAGR